MAKLLGIRRMAVAISSVSLILSLVILGGSRPAVGSLVSGNFTGYAMGNQYGASGNQVYTGDFANHLPSYCPNDPAAQWNYGSSVTLYSPSTILEHSAGGSSAYWSWLTLEDAGDLSCAEGNYWADVYFGRFEPSGGSCSCSGSPSPGYCEDDYGGYNGNSCTEAHNWGVVWATYYTP